MNILELRKRLGTLRDEQKAIVDAAETEDRDLTKEEQTKFDDLGSQCEALEKRIDRIESVAADQAALDQADPPVSLGANTPIDGATHNANPQIHWSGRANSERDPQRGFSHLGDFAASVYQAGVPGASPDQRLFASGDLQQQAIGSDGGFLVPPEFSTAIWDGLNTGTDNLVSMTDNYTVTGESLTFNANAESNRANASRYGGISSAWIGEGAQITESKVTFRQVKIAPHQLATLVYCTDKMLRNSAVALNQYITRAATEEINFMVNDAIINGTGAGQPKGILAGTAGAASARVRVNRENGQAATTLVPENLVKMWSRLHSRSAANAVWFINQDVLPQLLTMTLDGGTASTPVYLPPGGLSASPYGAILGRPVMPIEYCASLGTEGDVILADMKAYITGTRGGVESAMSMHLKFDYARTAFRFIYEIDGCPWTTAPITPFKGTSNTVAPFVTLQARS